MSGENKVTVVAPIQVEREVEKAAQEKASSFLALPEEKQQDLQYIRSILVSAGTNKNGAHFLPSELMKAHGTIVNKAIDLEHEEERVIGHIYECAFLYKDGETFDPRQLLAALQEKAEDPDALDIDVGIAGVIHKMRFPEIAEEISGGDWKVSMECFFRDFDIKVGEQIITRQEATSLGYSPDDLIGGFVRVMSGTKALGKHLVSRVLRDITFSGMGLVKNPANPHSIILETASEREKMEKNVHVIDLEHIDNLRNHSIEVSSEEEPVVEKSEEEVVQAVIPVTEGEEADAKNAMFIEVSKDTGGIKSIFCLREAGEKQENASRWSGSGMGGPGSVESFPDSVCKSFKKRVTRFNALDQSEMVVKEEHYCALFEEACPVIGASAKAPECLRNLYNRTVKDEGDDTLTKTVREHVQQGPGNTFVTVLHKPSVVNQSREGAGKASAEDRKAQTARIKQQTEELRSSVREFVAAEKKTSE